MGRTCAILNCTAQRKLDTSFHRMPSSSSPYRNIWIEFIRSARDDLMWTPGAQSVLCSNHFEDRFLYTSSNTKRCLFKTAIPSILERQYTTASNENQREIQMDFDGETIEDSRIHYFHNFVDENSLMFASLLLYKVFKQSDGIFISLGIDDNSSDSISFTHPGHSLPQNLADRSTTIRTTEDEVEPGSLKIRRRDTSVRRKICFSPSSPKTQQSLNDHSYADKVTLRTQNRRLRTNLQKTKKKLKQCQQVSKLRRIRALTLRHMYKDMKKTVGDQKLEVIRSNYSGVLKALIRAANQRQNVKDKTGIRYSDEIKTFSATLHFYSPRAYRFLQKHLQLPHETSLACWMSSVDCGPGFNLEVIRRLGEARNVAIGRCMDDIVIQMDEMAIRKGTPWNPKKHKYVGVIDYGTGSDLSDAPLATNALVVLFAGLAGGWKVPIGYIFTSKVSGSVQSSLITAALQLMDKNKFKVHAVVSDGNSSNVSMFASFGVCEDLNSVTSKFHSIPGVNSDVYAVYDIVHMIKLWRNMLHEYKVIFWRGQPIRWIYFEYLEQLQDYELIRAANKLTPEHIHFENNKMKVRLAVQVFSASVADAIDFCRDDMLLSQFKGSESTTKFIRMFNSAFDILNSRHPSQKGQKSPLNGYNFQVKRDFLYYVCDELKHMTTGPRKTRKNKDLPPIALWKSGRKRALLGFVVSIHSIISITEAVLFRADHPLRYVLTYRFCQDLIELLFNKVRGRLGANNDPDVMEFENIMKQIWHQNLLKSSNTGNCVIQMEESYLPGGLLPLQRPKKNALVSIVDFENQAEDYLDLVDTTCPEYSLFYTNCLVYIAGNVVKCISSKLKCQSCITALYNTGQDPLPSNITKLIDRKDHGGLIYPSWSVFKIVELADKVFRKYLSSGDILSTKYLDFKIKRKVLLLCNEETIFPTLFEHFLEFDPAYTENHQTSLTKSIVIHFLKIRLYDHGKKFKRVSNTETKRKVWNKMILFRNE